MHIGRITDIGDFFVFFGVTEEVIEHVLGATTWNIRVNAGIAQDGSNKGVATVAVHGATVTKAVDAGSSEGGSVGRFRIVPGVVAAFGPTEFNGGSVDVAVAGSNTDVATTAGCRSG